MQNRSACGVRLRRSRLQRLAARVCDTGSSIGKLLNFQAFAKTPAGLATRLCFWLLRFHFIPWGICVTSPYCRSLPKCMSWASLCAWTFVLCGRARAAIAGGHAISFVPGCPSSNGREGSRYMLGVVIVTVIIIMIVVIILGIIMISQV